MAETFCPFDPAENLDSAEAIHFFLLEAIKVEDPAYLSSTLKIVARAPGLAKLASSIGYSLEQILQAFAAPDNLSRDATTAALCKMGLQLPAFHKLRSGCA